MKVAEIRISVHVEGQKLAVVLEGDGVDVAQAHYPRKVTLEGAQDMVARMKPMLVIALGRCLRRAFEASRGGAPTR